MQIMVIDFMYISFGLQSFGKMDLKTTTMNDVRMG